MPTAEPTPAARPLEFQRMFAEVRAGIFGAGDPVRVGRYALRGRLGAGGMGVVYAADDAALGRRVAIKLLHGNDADGQARGRILREAQALARLSHPNVVQIYEVGEVGRQVFVAMEFVEGLTLAQWQRQQSRSWRELLEVYLQAGRGLAAAHRVGLVHRDFKPENVLVGADGRVRVLDFGLARAASEAPLANQLPTSDALLQPITTTGAMLGTALYMSPEQWRAQAADARSDQFSFCVALYAAVHGAPPFPANTAQALREQVLAGVVAAPPEQRRLPGRLRRALLRGLSREPARRFADMPALLAELERVRRGRPLTWLGLGVLALGVGAALGGRWSVADEPVSPDMCAGGAARVEAVWGSERRAAVRRAFMATEHADAGELWAQVAVQLDAYALAWERSHAAACQAVLAGEAVTDGGARGDLSEGPYLTMACLDRSLGELRALGDAFIGDAEAVIGNAVKAAYKLRPLEECRARPVLALLITPPADPATAVQVQALAGKLDEIGALLKAGEVARGIPRAREAAAQARALAHDHTTAEALVLLGSLESLAGDYPAAERSLFDAALFAESGDNRAALARARTELLFVVGYGLHRFDEGLRWGDLAGNAMRQVGRGGALEVRLRSARGLVQRARGDLPAARVELREALTLAEATLGPDNPGVATALINLAGVQAEAGERGAASVGLRRALAIRERTLGPEHPDTRRAAEELAALDKAVPRDSP
ncbi:MAG: serine/threonine protein kinase [Nannocystis sp.]|uniref:serine/threonine-protein kinase n=1 Tax=Nannocystis sp. TaxID=1962667 RepID=UPI0024228BDD|nr:serine/threonine-protein kinase [Nannocystis sp.]MBK9754003.1 serine/threonine protein kinase [Nannocystis sp.]